MKTEKKYTEITPLDGLEMLVENEGEPVSGMAFRDSEEDGWTESEGGRLAGVGSGGYPFIGINYPWKYCAKVETVYGYGYTKEGEKIEAPEGFEIVPEGEVCPRGAMYYSVLLRTWREATAICASYCCELIRAYAQPIPHLKDAFEAWIADNQIGFEDDEDFKLAREAYELGQRNPK